MTTYYNRKLECQNCFIKITDKVFDYSTQNFGCSLCWPCQKGFCYIFETTSATPESISLYFALRRRGVPAELEYDDGFKRVDIAVPEAKVHIEVDGVQHNLDSQQAMRDLTRTLNSYKRGYCTLRIPNSLVKHNLKQTAEKITEFLVVSRDKKTKQYKPVNFAKLCNFKG